MKRALLGLVLLTLSSASLAKEAPPIAQDPAVEARLLKVGKELRCLVCQNETLVDSHADLAQDLRREVRELIRQGKTDEEIKSYLTQRYGDFVLYRPRVTTVTWLLWFGPFLLLAGAALGVGLFIRRRRRALDETPLTAEESARIKSLLPNDQGKQV